LKVLTVIGARPQFIKAAPVSRELRKYDEEILVHTGQHYDRNMSDIFFEELSIPKPDYNLEVGSGNHGWQTGQMLIKIEEVILKEHPDALLVYGDTNSTLAGALAAGKLHIPVIHVEAGLRSFNMKMPEEQNRILTDHISSLLFCPTETAVHNLKNEGISQGVYHIGDVMFDAVLQNINAAAQKYNMNSILSRLNVIGELGRNRINIEKITPKQYYLATIHRAENTYGYEKLKTILKAFELLDLPVIMPVHPRTRKIVEDNVGRRFNNIFFVEPVSYLEMLYMTQNARKVITDSGGLQKEAFFLGTACVTLRDQTEWVETLTDNWNVLSKIDHNEIVSIVIKEKRINVNNAAHKFFGQGNAAKKAVEIIRQIKPEGRRAAI